MSDNICEERPPLGVQPEASYRLKANYTRLLELAGALERYSDAGKLPKQEWVNELCRRLQGGIPACTVEDQDE